MLSHIPERDLQMKFNNSLLILNELFFCFCFFTLYFPAIIPSYQMCTKDIIYNLSGLFVLFLCTMKSDCVNDTSFKRKMLPLKGCFVIAQENDFSNMKDGWGISVTNFH